MTKPVLRCSSLDRVLLCNGSPALVERVAPREGEEGDEGRDIHAAISRRLIVELGATGPSQSEQCNPVKKNSQWIVDFCFRATQEVVPPDWSLETEAAIAYEFENFILSGHPDVIALSPDGAEVICDDYKSGYTAVDEAEINEQLLGYCANLKRAYETLKRGRFRIIQPRNSEDDGHPRISEVVIEDMDAALKGFEVRVNKALANSRELNSGRTQCRFCPAALQCPALIAERYSMKATITEQGLAVLKAKPDDATLADWVVAGKTIAQPLEDARAMAKSRIELNGQIVANDGTVITQKTTRGAYKVIRPLELWETLKGLLTEEGRAMCASWSMTKIKDRIAQEMKIPATGKAAVTSETVFDAQVRTFVEQGTRSTFDFN